MAMDNKRALSIACEWKDPERIDPQRDAYKRTVEVGIVIGSSRRVESNVGRNYPFRQRYL